MNGIAEKRPPAAFGPPCQRASYATRELWGVSVVAHPLIADHLVRTCQAAHRAINAAGAGHTVPRRMDSYNCRKIAGTDSWSLHAYALAWDVFRTLPGVVPPGGVYSPDDALHPALVATFERAGFTWGGRWSRPDRPHFEWTRPPP